MAATFSDSDPNGNANDFTATINWGDGHLSNGTIKANAQGGFDVLGTNTYFSPGEYTINVDVQDFGGVNTQLAGNRVEMSAKHLAALGVTLAPERGLIVNLGVNYTGDRFLNKRNTAKVPAFATVDAGVGYRLECAEFRVDGKNLGDRRDAVSESEFGDAQYYRMTARSVQAGVVLNY